MGADVTVVGVVGTVGTVGNPGGARTGDAAGDTGANTRDAGAVYRHSDVRYIYGHRHISTSRWIIGQISSCLEMASYIICPPINPTLNSGNT